MYGLHDRPFFISVTGFMNMSRPDSVEVCLRSPPVVNYTYIEVNWSKVGEIKFAKQEVL
jgi:hypothetical protein